MLRDFRGVGQGKKLEMNYWRERVNAFDDTSVEQYTSPTQKKSP